MDIYYQNNGAVQDYVTEPCLSLYFSLICHATIPPIKTGHFWIYEQQIV